MENIYVIDDILLFKHGITAQRIYNYNDLDKVAGEISLFSKVYFVTSDINSIMHITDKIKKIFMLLKPRLLILQDDKRTRTLTVFQLFHLMENKKQDEILKESLIDNVEKQLKVLDKSNVGKKYNRKGNPIYLKTTMAYGVQAGGMVAHSTGVLKGLEKKYSNVRVYTTDYISSEIKEAEIHHISMRRFHDFGELRNLYFNFSAYKEICSIQKNERPSFVYQRCSLNNFIGLKLAKRYNVPFVLEFNSSEVWTSKNWGAKLKYENLSERIEQMNLDGADLIVCVSDELRNTLVGRGIDQNKILVNYNGVDEKKYMPDISGDKIRKKYNLGDKTVIGFSGSFGKFHGAEKLAEVYGNLIRKDEKYRTNTCLFLIGEGVTLPLVKRIVKQLRIEDCVIYTGSVPFEDMPSYLAACDILVAPHVRNKDGSDFFGSPTKLFEYMAMGKAIAASDLNQIGDILTDNDTALLFEPENIEQMESTLVSLVDDEQLRSRLGINARADVISKYTWDIHVDRILRKLEER